MTLAKSCAELQLRSWQFGGSRCFWWIVGPHSQMGPGIPPCFQQKRHLWTLIFAATVWVGWCMLGEKIGLTYMTDGINKTGVFTIHDLNLHRFGVGGDMGGLTSYFFFAVVFLDQILQTCVITRTLQCFKAISMDTWQYPCFFFNFRAEGGNFGLWLRSGQSNPILL